MKRTLVAVLLLWLLCPSAARAQELLPSVWQYYLEQLSDEGDDETAEDMLELYESLHDTPSNLNDTVALLSIIPFVSDLQRERLRLYIKMYGDLLSVDELYAINGFDSLTVELLRPIVKAEPLESSQPLTLKELLTRGRSNLVMGIGGTVEQARGYRDSIYEGDNLRLMWRYRYKYKDRIQFQLSADKDPGEALFAASQRRGFDFYGYSLLVNDMARWRSDGTSRNVYIKRFIAGQYHLQFGQGLTLWSGFGPRMTMNTGINRYAQGLRPNGAFTEYGYMQGVATILALDSRWNVSLFASYVDRDATLPRNASSNSGVDWVQSIYNSGYHRTTTEVGKRNQLGETLFGTHWEYRNSNLRLGMTTVATLLSKPIVPATYVYNDNAFRGKENFNAGFDFAYRSRRVMWFGEASFCANRPDSVASSLSPAVLAGAEFLINSNHSLSSYARYYSPTYHNLHANAIGQNGTPQNEMGVGLNYRGRLMWGVEAVARADWYRFPHMKYLAYAPTHGQEYNLMLTRASRRIKGLALNVRYRYKERGRNITPSTQVDGHYLLEQTYRHQCMVDVEYKTGSWRLVSRMGYAHYHGDVTEADRGLLFYQDVHYTPSTLPLTVAARIAIFDVNDYEARMYAAESDFIYNYSSTLYQNEGCRFYLLLRYDITPHWNIGFKYSITAYADKDTFGSGYEQIDANHRQQWRIQMRLKW